MEYIFLVMDSEPTLVRQKRTSEHSKPLTYEVTASYLNVFVGKPVVVG